MDSISAKRSFLRGKHLRRIFIPFLIVITLPILVSAIFYSARVKEQFKQNILEEVDRELLQIVQELDFELVTVKNFSNNLIQRGILRYALGVAEPVDYTPLMTELNRFKESHAFLEQVFVFFPNADYIVMNTTTSTKDRFLDQLTKMSDYSNFVKQLERERRDFYFSPPSASSVEVRGSHREPGQLIVGHPVSDYNSRPKATFVYTLKNLQRLLRTFEQKSHESSIFLKDLDESDLFAKSFGSAQENEEAGRTFDQFLNDEHYLHRKVESEMSGWTLHAFIGSRSGFFAQLKNLNQIYLLIVAFTVLIALTLLYITYKFGYEPVMRLNTKVYSINPHSFGYDEINNITYAIDRLLERNQNLSKSLDQSSLTLRNHLVYRLITGRYKNVEEFNLEGASHGLHLGKKLFFVFILNFADDNPENAEQIAAQIQEALMPEIMSYYLLDLRSKQIVFVGNTDKDSVYIRKALRLLVEEISDPSSTDLLIACSFPTPKFDEWVQAFLEASMALDYKFLYDDRAVLFLDEVRQYEDTKFDFPYAIFDFFRNALLHKNTEQLEQAVSGITGILEMPGLSLHIIKSICTETERLIHEYTEPAPKDPEESDPTPFQFSAIYETKSEFIEELKQWTGKKHKEWEENSEPGFTFTDVTSYLEDNVLSGDFSIYSIADHFGMNTSTFSKYFKEQSGHNFSDQMTAYRMSKAKELLQNSNIEVRDVAAEVGYYNVSSFNRRFKQVVGVTPTQFRQSYQK